MFDWIAGNEIVIRLSVFFGVFLVMAVWEVIAPRRALTASKAVRWVNNIALVFLNSFLLRLLFPAAAVGVAVVAGRNDWGLFNVIDVPFPVAAIVSVVILDFIIYLQHVKVPGEQAL